MRDQQEEDGDIPWHGGSCPLRDLGAPSQKAQPTRHKHKNSFKSTAISGREGGNRVKRGWNPRRGLI